MTSPLACPYCSAPLRIRDRGLIGRKAQCPECEGTFRVIDDGADGIAFKSIESSRRSPAPDHLLAADAPHPKPRESSPSVGQSLINPRNAAWCVAATMCILIASFLIVRSTRTDGSPPVDTVAQALPDEGAEPKPNPLQPNKPAAGDNDGKQRKPNEVKIGAAGDVKMAANNDVLLEPVAAPRPPATPVAPGAPPAPGVIEPPPLPFDGPVVAVKPPPTAPRSAADIQTALELPIVSFEQTTPASVRDLLLQVEELAGVPIRFDADELQTASISLDDKVRLELHGTTIGKILDALLLQFGLAYEVKEGTIFLRPESAVPSNREPS